MSRLVHPVLFSKQFGISSAAFDKAGLIEPILNCDTKLFIDPTLIQSSSNPAISGLGFQLLSQRYKDIVDLVDASSKHGDLSWRSARELVNLDECPGLHLGFGGSGTSGSSRPIQLREEVLETIKQAIALGEKNPRLLQLVGLFEKDIGPDTIGDFAGHGILPALIQISAAFYKKHKLPTVEFADYGNARLVANPTNTTRPILLVPRDIVRHLPLAADWSDIGSAITQNENIRKAFSAHFIQLSKASLTQRKTALRAVGLSSRKMLRELLTALLEYATNYDENEDVFNYYALRKLLAGDISIGRVNKKKIGPETLDSLHESVMLALGHFQKLVETNNLWELLWVDNNPKRERAAQLLFYGVADAYCKANNWDITPEANMGGGPVDFKFSSGYDARVVVELKKSTGTVESSYKAQLEIYKAASATDRGVFVIVNVGGLGSKLAKIKAIQKKRIESGSLASDIVSIDARRRPSASNAKSESDRLL